LPEYEYDPGIKKMKGKGVGGEGRKKKGPIQLNVGK